MISDWVVHKFGGTSLQDAECYQRAAKIAALESGKRKAVVVSAMGGATDELLAILKLAIQQEQGVSARIDAFRDRYLKTLKAISKKFQAEKAIIETETDDLKKIVETVRLSKSVSDQTSDLFLGYGELWSARLFNAHLLSRGFTSSWLDAREVLVVTHSETGPVVDWKLTGARLSQWMKSHESDWMVVTGFVASTAEGVPTTLKRNGSDYTASIFGRALGARSITIWTDVDGVMSADPRQVPEAVVLSEMSYQEAMELAYFGAKILHPHTMSPAVEREIPIFIRNTFKPESVGTRIHGSIPTGSQIVKGLSTVQDVTLINVEGSGMIGVPGVAQRLFGTLREARVSVIMISQASSEHSICFAIESSNRDRAIQAIQKAFQLELLHGQIQTIDVQPDCAVLAVVGEKMAHTPGVSGMLFRSLGQAGVNVRAIAQGSSERNISVVVHKDDVQRALRAVHAGFFLSRQTISIGVIGPGLIGKTFLNQLKNQTKKLNEDFGIDLRLRGLAGSKKMFLSEKAVPISKWENTYKKADTRCDLDAFSRHIRADHIPHAVIVDCTASEDVSKHYSEWLRRGIHIVTPNKKANSSGLAYYRELKAIEASSLSRYYYEATVGAGLPVISTLRDLVQTGDQILEIEGILSGTLSYIFNSFKDGKKFSDIVIEAKKNGFTEPDPRDDLSGTDVARKLIILAREMGLELELKDIQLRSLVPSALASIERVDDFMSQLPNHDSDFEAELKAAGAKSEVLRYVGRIDSNGKASVELKSYPLTHAFARISGSDNIIAFRTSRYSEQPLIVQGPGAGPEVTAGGVFADLLRLSAILGGVD